MVYRAPLSRSRPEPLYHLHAALMDKAFIVRVSMIRPIGNRQAAKQTKLLTDITGDLVEQAHVG